jgi:predicted Zn-dependent protease
MADFVFNRSKGRVVQFAELIIGNAAPYVNAQFVITLWRRGSQTHAAIKDFDDVAAIEADAQLAELVSGTNANYVEKLINEGTLTRNYDDTNEWVDVDFPDITWTALGAGGTAITDLLVAFDNDSTVGTVRDSAVVPMTFHGFSVTPDGSDVTAQLAALGFFRAQ